MYRYIFPLRVNHNTRPTSGSPRGLFAPFIRLYVPTRVVIICSHFDGGARAQRNTLPLTYGSEAGRAVVHSPLYFFRGMQQQRLRTHERVDCCTSNQVTRVEAVGIRYCMESQTRRYCQIAYTGAGALVCVYAEETSGAHETHGINMPVQDEQLHVGGMPHFRQSISRRRPLL